MEFTNKTWGTANTKQNSALEILVKSEKKKLTSSLEALEDLEAQGRRNKQTSALEVLHTSALDALVQSEEKLIADLKAIEALEAQMQRSSAPVAEETRDADNTKPSAPWPHWQSGYGSNDQPKMMHMSKENPSLHEKSPASHITEDMPKIWDRVMNMPGLSNEEKRQLWMMILNGSTQNSGGREDAESTEGSTTSADEMIFEERVVLPSNEAKEVASQITANTVFQFANNIISDATEVVSQAIAPTKEGEDTSKADAPPIVDIDLPSPTAKSVAENSANNSILEDGSLKSTDKDEERSDLADVDLAKVLKHRSKVLCKNMARRANKTSKAITRAADRTSKAAVRTSKVVGQTSSSVAKSSKKRLGLTRSSIAKSSKKGIGSVSSRLASKKARAADPTSKAVSSTSKAAEQTSSSTAKSPKKGLSRGSALKRVGSMRGSALKRVGSMRGKFSKSTKDGATKTTGDYNIIISCTNSESSYPLNGGSVQPEEQKSNSYCNIFEGIFCCLD